MANRYLVGTGARNLGDSANWSETSGGAGGASVPTSADAVFLDANSGTGTVTINADFNCASFDASALGAATTIAGSVYLFNCYGSFTGNSFLTFTLTGTSYFYSKGTGTIIQGGAVLNWNKWIIHAAGGTVTNGDDLVLTSNGNISIVAGTWNTNSKNITAYVIDDPLYLTKGIILGASVVTCYWWQVQDTARVTIDPGTSTIIFTAHYFYGAEKTYYNVESTMGSGTIRQACTFNNLTFAVVSFQSESIIESGVTVNGVLTIKGYNSSSIRKLIRTGAIGTQRTITCNGTLVLESVDFRDIAVAGTASWDLSAITGGSGDCGGNSGITFTPAQAQYYKHTGGGTTLWSDGTKWFSDSGLTVAGRVPLPQDTAMFIAGSFSSACTLTIDCMRIPGFDMSGVNQTLTANFGSNGVEVYGSLIANSANVTLGFSYRTVYMFGRGEYFINTNFSGAIYIYAGTYKLLANLSISGSSIVTSIATLDLNGFNLNAGRFENIVGNLYLRTGTTTLTQSSSYAFFYNSDKIVPGTSTLVLINIGTDSLPVRMSTNNTVFNKVILQSTGTGNISVQGTSSFNELVIVSGTTVKFVTGITQTINKITAKGTATNRITLTSTTTTPATINYTGTIQPDIKFANISYITATTPFAVRASTDVGNNTGITFNPARFWVGGTGNINDASKWSLTSGGSPYTPTGTEVIAQPLDFITDSWVVIGAATISDANTLNLTGVGGVYKSILVVGKWYKLVVSGTSTQAVSVMCASAGGSTRVEIISGVNGTAYFKATYNYLYIRKSYAGSGQIDIDNISLQEVDDIAPTASIDAFFDENSLPADAQVVTLNADFNCLTLDFENLTKTMTFTGSVYVANIFGGLYLSGSKLTWTQTGTSYAYLKATTSQPIQTSGMSASFNRFYMNGAGGVWTHLDNFTAIGGTTIYLDNGTWTTNDKTITSAYFNSVLSNPITINLGSSDLFFSIWTGYAQNLILNSGTSNLYLSGSSIYTLSCNKTFYNIFLTGTAQIMTSALKCNNLTVDIGGSNLHSFVTQDQTVTVNGVLTLKGANSTNNRILVSRTNIICNGSIVAENADFYRIALSGTAAPFDASSIPGGSGDCGGNSNIIFTPAQPKYYKHTGGGTTLWSDVTKWFTDQALTVAGRVPLPQDDANFIAGSFDTACTLSVNCPRIGGLDMSGVNVAVVMSLANAIEVYGKLLCSSLNTISGAVANSMNFLGVGVFDINLQGVSTGRNVSFSRGTFNLTGNISAPRVIINSGIVNAGASIIECTYTSNAQSFYMIGGTFNAEQSTIILKTFNISAYPSFQAYGSFNIVKFSGSPLYYTIFYGITANEIIIEPGLTVKFGSNGNFNIAKLTAIGTPEAPITITGNGAQHTMNFTGAGLVNVENCNISYSKALPVNRFFAMDSVDGGNNTGWNFGQIGASPGDIAMEELEAFAAGAFAEWTLSPNFSETELLGCQVFADVLVPGFGLSEAESMDADAFGEAVITPDFVEVEIMEADLKGTALASAEFIEHEQAGDDHGVLRMFENILNDVTVDGRLLGETSFTTEINSESEIL